jgi:protein involved in polysaccharide export with SLBB domain
MRSLLAALAAAALCGCVTTVPIHQINEKYRAQLNERQQNYRIKPGDTVTIKFYNLEPELTQALLVLPDGRTDPFFMDNTVFAGKTVKELEGELVKYYAKQVTSPEISVLVAPAGETVVMEGEVLRPIPQPLTLKMTLLQALGNAGGYKITGSLKHVIVRRPFLNAEHPDVFRVDVWDYADIPEELFLLPNDHIIVEKHWLINIRDYITEYVWGFLPPFLRGGGGTLTTAITVL